MMCKKINKNKRGFSLVELMVVVAIMGTLAAIAIPAYNEYRQSAKKAAYKSDLNSLHKGWLAFGVELDSFCERETKPEQASIETVGMESLLTSKLYSEKPEQPNFIGFSGINANCPLTTYDGTKYTGTSRGSLVSSNTKTVSNIVKKEAIASASSGGPPAPAQCQLGVTAYEMGVYGHISGDTFFGVGIDNNGVLTTEHELSAADIKGASGVCT